MNVISSNGDISYDSATKTLNISGEISDINIIQARQNGNWYNTVENVFFQPGTRLSITQTSTGNVAGLFSSASDQQPCSNLKNLTMNNVTYVNATGDQNATCYLSVAPQCDKITSFDISSPTIEAIGNNKLALSLTDPTAPLQTLKLNGWSAANFSVSGGGSYEGPVLNNYTNLSSIIASAKYWQNLPYMQYESEAFPLGTWALTTDFVNYTPVSSYVEWKAYCNGLSPNQTVYCTIDNAPDIQTTFNANGGYFNTQGEETVTTSTSQYALLSLPPETPLNSNPGAVFLGYANDPQATDAEIIPGDTTTYPKGMEAAGIYYAVWHYKTSVKTIFIAGDGSFETGSHELVQDSWAGDQLVFPDQPTAPSGKEFLGWFTELSGGTQIADGDVVPDVPYAFYYAHYSGNDPDPGPVPPGPTPGPAPDPVPDVTPASDDASLLPITGDTQHASISSLLAAACTGTALLGMAGVLKRHRD